MWSVGVLSIQVSAAEERMARLVQVGDLKLQVPTLTVMAPTQIYGTAQRENQPRS